jgi:glyceraldehyde-3-phosphate dehydrogenase (NADP+)
MITRVDSPAPVFPKAAEVPAALRPEPPERHMRYLIDGTVREWTGPSRKVLSPVCLAGDKGTEPCHLGSNPLMGESEAMQALEAAVRAYGKGCGAWPTMSVADRIRHMEAFVPRMEAVRDDVVRLMMWEIGKTLGDSRKEFDRTVEYIRDTVTALKELDRNSSRFNLEQGFIAQIRRSPLGVVLCMGPFNYPLNETFTTLIPALIMGNTVVFKPPKLGVLLYRPLMQAFAESFPPGVINTVFGAGATVVAPLTQSGQIDVLAFIGSAKAASMLKHQHPYPNRLRSVLGLEAKNPAVILADADLDQAVRECVLGTLSFNGQRCTAIKIIFVHKSLYDRFCTRFADAVGALKVGMPWEDGAQITPLPEENKPQWLKELVDDAAAGGAPVINRGGATIDQTLFYPAVLSPANPRMKICQVEQFGPVTPIVPYADEQEPVNWLIASPHGQQAALFGRDPQHLSRLIDPLVNQVCRVNINSQCQRGPDKFPFNGRKDSAEGTLSVADALRSFSIRSLVAVKATQENQQIITRIVAERHSKFLSTEFIL